MAAEATFTYTPDPAGQRAILGSETGSYARWLTRVGNTAASNAKRRANVRTGLMRSGIEFYITTEGGQLVGVLVARTSYAKFVHDGTRFYPGNPFLTDGIRDALA